MFRSEPVDANNFGSAGLNFTDVMVSAPHENVWVGSDRAWSQIETVLPDVAKIESPQ